MDTEEQDQKIRTSARHALEKVYGEGKVSLCEHCTCIMYRSQLLHMLEISVNKMICTGKLICDSVFKQG